MWEKGMVGCMGGRAAGRGERDLVRVHMTHAESWFGMLPPLFSWILDYNIWISYICGKYGLSAKLGYAIVSLYILFCF